MPASERRAWLQSMRTVGASLLAVGLVGVVGGCSADPPVPVHEVEAFCAALRDRANDLATVFNGAAVEAAAIDEPAQRHERWLVALDDMDGVDRRFGADLDRMMTVPRPWRESAATAIEADLAPLVSQARAGVDVARARLAQLRAVVEESPELDEAPPNERTEQVAVRAEKVVFAIEVSAAELTTPVASAALRAEPACRFTISDR